MQFSFVERVSDYLGKVTILSVGPLINLAIIYGDPEAAGVGFISGADITVGINISTQLKLTDDDLLALRNSKGNAQDC
ncbi:uridine nucleosidase 1-like [Brassica napus]|uniref:uridine nucleosidase 1-like n=1 Tax=Brassica napus TaxID=3708 RepID=UPI0020790631|nr:uridine nucleosidase 1-like [Brassica napus]